MSNANTDEGLTPMSSANTGEGLTPPVCLMLTQENRVHTFHSHFFRCLRVNPSHCTALYLLGTVTQARFTLESILVPEELFHTWTITGFLGTKSVWTF